MARLAEDDVDDGTTGASGEFTRKWTEREEAALLTYWRENVAKYATKTKRFFYDGAMHLPELRNKTISQIKSKCFDTEKRYRDTNHMLRAAGIDVSGGANPDTSRKWVLKKFSLYYDVHPFLGPRDPTLNGGLTGEDARAINGGSVAADNSDMESSPPPAGVRSFVAPPATGKKRVLIGQLAAASLSQSPRVVSKRHRPEIERFVKVNEEAVATIATAAATTPTNNAAGAPSSSSSSSNADPASQYPTPHVQENSAMVAAATEKLRAEARLATIRANAALLRERKALMDEGISVNEINALLPLEASRTTL